ncbi:propionyl-CoA synthetase [Stieleria mannarensis]|uniref:propionyl-CoA synthetase n=1 Tax=Stieleria mannarensis TaxID=2755585 RepID=UPI00257104DA|nr:propionyl-CoA synthetase [Rhodopirellula sp. JC639]
MPVFIDAGLHRFQGGLGGANDMGRQANVTGGFDVVLAADQSSDRNDPADIPSVFSLRLHLLAHRLLSPWWLCVGVSCRSSPQIVPSASRERVKMTYQRQYRHSIEQPEAFWREQARQIAWFREPKQILSRDEEGFDRWFPDGQLNTAYLALDWHLDQGRGEQTALIYDSPVTQTSRRYTFRQLRDEVARLAGALRQLGVDRGDAVIIYMPMIPQIVVAMLACARLGAIHSVVFGGFAAHELAVRIDDLQPKVILAASAGKEVDRVVDYGTMIDAALAESAHSPAYCVMYQRDFHRVDLHPGRDFDWEALVASADPIDCVPVLATDPLYVLYTSGTTGRPKGILRDHGGHAVAMKYSMQYVYGVQPGEVFWAASDVGWVVGHSCIVYGPLVQGCTTVLFEGKPIRTPDAGAFWRVVAEHRVRSMFAAPTAIRAIKREDPEGQKARGYDTSCLRYLFVAGERCDVATLDWAERTLHVPVIDHWWQTESGWPMIANMAGLKLMPIRPGSATKPVCGYDIRILDRQGHELSAGKEGAVAVRLPLPPGCLPNLWRNTARFKNAYLVEYPGYYASGDGGYRDKDGYFYITGRMDDVINVAGHRLSTATMEEALAGHPAVAECAVIGVADAIKGQVPLGFVVLKSNVTLEPSALEAELIHRVREQVGPVAALKHVIVAERLPKTRSGKILRRTMRQMSEGQPWQPPSTIEDPVVLDELSTLLDGKGVTVSEGTCLEGEMR